MKKQKRSTMVLAVMVCFIVTGLFMPGLIGAGDLEPTAPPGPTMKTLDEIPPTWSLILPASERFKLVMGDEAVLDKETGLVWAKNANIFTGAQKWHYAMMYSRKLLIGGRKGWRLPTVEELSSLVDKSQSYPALPDGHPFDNVQGGRCYWSSTTLEDTGELAYRLDMSSGTVHFDSKTDRSLYIWPVRGGN